MKRILQHIDVETTLSEHGFKKTPLRLFLLEILSNATAPLSVASLARKTKKLKADTATIYRALNAFVETGIVTMLNVDTHKSLYQITHPKVHLHHIMCDTCNTVESIPFCIKSLDQQVVKQSRQFKKVHGHTLAFVGTCRKCLRAVR